MISINLACAAFIALASSSALIASEQAENFAVDNASTSLIERKNSYNNATGFTGTYYFFQPTDYNGNMAEYTYISSASEYYQMQINAQTNTYNLVPYYIDIENNELVGVMLWWGTGDPDWTPFWVHVELWNTNKYVYARGLLSICAKEIDQKGYNPVWYEDGSIEMDIGSNTTFKIYPYNAINEYWVSFKESTFIQEYGDTYSAGYDKGYQDAKDYWGNIKYDEGYTAGQNSITTETTAITMLFSAIASVPASVLNGLAPLTIWEVSIISILVTFLMLCLIIWVVKKFI